MVDDEDENECVVELLDPVVDDDDDKLVSRLEDVLLVVLCKEELEFE